MIANLIPIIAQLATAGIQVYQDMHAATQANDISKIASLIPVVAEVYTEVHKAGYVLQKAQAEGWPDDDARWAGVFAEADAALKMAEDRLTKPA